MKVAFSGKGGVGKTTVAAAVARHLAEDGTPVLAVDADMDPNLAGALGISEEIPPLSEEKKLIFERMEVNPAAPGMYKLNPFVQDIPGKYAVKDGSLTLVVMGGVERGGRGCACPENAFLRELLTHIMVTEEEWVIVDMEAGVEHMGRATAHSVDVMVIVAEPTPRAVQTAKKVERLAGDIGVSRMAVVGNKVRGEEDAAWLRDQVAPLPVVGWIPFLEAVSGLERRGERGFFEILPRERVEDILKGVRGLAEGSKAPSGADKT